MADDKTPAGDIASGKVVPRPLLKQVELLPDGVHTGEIFGSSVESPKESQTFKVSLDRANWTDPNVRVEINIEISNDGGFTWQLWGTTVDYPPFNNPDPTSVEAPVDTPGSLFRVSKKIAGGSLRTSSKLDFS